MELNDSQTYFENVTFTDNRAKKRNNVIRFVHDKAATLNLTLVGSFFDSTSHFFEPNSSINGSYLQIVQIPDDKQRFTGINISRSSF